jgi:hypothetical protein
LFSGFLAFTIGRKTDGEGGQAMSCLLLDDDGGYLFTCKKCGGHDLRVVHEYTLIEEYEETLPCVCRKRDSSVAAVRHYHFQTQMREGSWLDGDHHFDDVDDREKGDRDTLKDKMDVSCSHCLERSSASDWAVEQIGEAEIDNEKFSVHCTCGREVEFGWSHPDRGGRIWPAECSDFNPWRSFPEERFTESWRKKGWLRPA